MNNLKNNPQNINRSGNLDSCISLLILFLSENVFGQPG